MFALLIWVCVAGHADDCRVALVADGFVSEEKCGAAAPLLLTGWFTTHHGFEPRDGTRPICTTQANYLLNRFKA